MAPSRAGGPASRTYALHQLPWFEHYDPEGIDLPTSEVLAAVSSVAEVDDQHGFVGQQDDSPLPPGASWPVGPHQPAVGQPHPAP